MNHRAITYRRLHDIPAEWGTAVNVQAMVYGNMGDDCATGVCFTRDPSTGENTFYGEYLVNAQGEDVVAGIRTPQPVSKASARPGEMPMEAAMPEAYAELLAMRETLEKHYRDMQDMEFTVQQNKLYMLQTRNGKRTTAASLRMAVDMAREGLIDRSRGGPAGQSVGAGPVAAPDAGPEGAAHAARQGPAGQPGRGQSGEVVFSADEAESAPLKGEAVILVRIETSPEDIHGMHAARGILTTRGGMTSHAAVVARGMGRPCVAGAGGIAVDYNAQTLSAAGKTVRAGETITLDGATGEVFIGSVAMVEPAMSGRFRDADGVGRQGAPDGRARQCRDAAGRRNRAQVRRRGHRPVPHRAYVLRSRADRRGAADDHGERRGGPPRRAGPLLPFQREDFRELFTIMAGLPVTIRLLDPPLHEFLPHADAEMQEVAAGAGHRP